MADSSSIASCARGRSSAVGRWNELSSTAASSVSRLRRARCGEENLAATISPCSVTRIARVDRARRLGEDRVVARAAAAADGAAAAVEQAQAHAVRRGDLDEALLGAVQRPVGREVAAVLGRVGVADHHLLRPAAAGRATRRYAGSANSAAITSPPRPRSAIVSNSGHDVDGQPGLLGEDGGFEHVADRLALGDDHVLHGGDAEAPLAVGGGVEDGQLVRCVCCVRRVRARAAGGDRPARPQQPRPVRSSASAT